MRENKINLEVDSKGFMDVGMVRRLERISSRARIFYFHDSVSDPVDFAKIFTMDKEFNDFEKDIGKYPKSYQDWFGKLKLGDK